MRDLPAAILAAFLVMGLVSCGDGGDQQAYDWGWQGDVPTDTATDPDVAAGDDATRDVHETGDSGGDESILHDASTDSVAGDSVLDSYGEDAAQPADSGDPDATEATDVPTDPTVGGFDLTGTWAQLHVTSRLVKPFMGSPTPSATTSIQLVRITFESGRFFIETDLCSLTLGQTSAVVSTVVPQAFVNSIPTSKLEFSLVENDGAVLFTEPENVVLYGVNLANPMTDPLPDKVEDPTVWDQDGDGHPGMTIQVKGLIAGEYYLVQRTVTSMTGPVQSNDRFDGLITSATEQNYLAADPESLMSYVPETSPDTDPSNSYYRHQRIDPSWGCSEIIEKSDELFDR